MGLQQEVMSTKSVDSREGAETLYAHRVFALHTLKHHT